MGQFSCSDTGSALPCRRQRCFGPGLTGVRLVVSDHRLGLKAASPTVMIGAVWQRCRMYLMRNVLAKVPDPRILTHQSPRPPARPGPRRSQRPRQFCTGPTAMDAGTATTTSSPALSATCSRESNRTRPASSGASSQTADPGKTRRTGLSPPCRRPLLHHSVARHPWESVAESPRASVSSAEAAFSILTIGRRLPLSLRDLVALYPSLESPSSRPAA